jgi:hypothetical protein
VQTRRPLYGPAAAKARVFQQSANGPDDTATFGVSNGTDIEINSWDIEVNGIVFNAGASAFTIAVLNFGSFTTVLAIRGVGITNNSGITQSFVAPNTNESSSIQFTNNATAGNLTSGLYH